MKKKTTTRGRGRTSRKTTKPKYVKAKDLNLIRSWAIYGRAGTGKTTLVASFPKPILILDVRDEGTDSIVDQKDVFVAVINSWDDFEEVLADLQRNPDQFKTVAIDTITQLQQILVEGITAGKNLKGKRAGDWGTLTKSDWGTISAMMKSTIMNIRSLPMETVFIAQERIFDLEDEDEEISSEVDPQLSPSVSSHLCASVTVILNCFIRQKEKKGKKLKKAEFCIRLGPNESYITKVRNPKSAIVPGVMADIGYPEILEIIKG